MTTLKKNTIYSGILLGILSVLITILFYYLNTILNSRYLIAISIALTTLIIPIILIAFTTNKAKKNNDFNNLIEVIKISTRIMIISAITSTLLYTLMFFIILDFYEQILNYLTLFIKGNDVKVTIRNPIYSTPFEILKNAFLGLIYGLIIGTIFKKEQPHF